MFNAQSLIHNMKERSGATPARLVHRMGPDQPTVILPARGILARDLALVCRFQGLPLVPRPALAPPSKPSVNAISAAFIATLQDDLPSAISTVQRTAGKLQVIALAILHAPGLETRMIQM